MDCLTNPDDLKEKEKPYERDCDRCLKKGIPINSGDLHPLNEKQAKEIGWKCTWLNPVVCTECKEYLDSLETEEHNKTERTLLSIETINC